MGGGRSDGHILKIWGIRRGPSPHTQCRVKFPFEGLTLTKKVLFRAHLKIVKGAANFQTDVAQHVRWTQRMSEGMPDGWLQISEEIDSSHITDLDYCHALTFNAYGDGPEFMGEFLMYLALPYVANLVNGNESHWQSSVLDALTATGQATWAQGKFQITAPFR